MNRLHCLVIGLVIFMGTAEQTIEASSSKVDPRNWFKTPEEIEAAAKARRAKKYLKLLQRSKGAFLQADFDYGDSAIDIRPGYPVKVITRDQLAHHLYLIGVYRAAILRLPPAEQELAHDQLMELDADEVATTARLDAMPRIDASEEEEQARREAVERSRKEAAEERLRRAQAAKDRETAAAAREAAAAASATALPTDRPSALKILGLPDIHTTTLAQVEKKYRQLVLKYHPDKNPGDEEALAKFHQVQTAYELLRSLLTTAK